MKKKSLPEKSISWHDLFPFSLFWVGYDVLFTSETQTEEKSSFKQNSIIGFKAPKSS